MCISHGAALRLLAGLCVVAMAELLGTPWVWAEPPTEIVGTWQAERRLFPGQVFSGDQAYSPEKLQIRLTFNKDGTFMCRSADPAFFNERGKYSIRELGKGRFLLLLEVNNHGKEVQEIMCLLDSHRLCTIDIYDHKRPPLDLPKDVDEFIAMGRPGVVIFRRVADERTKP
uniref:Uncharacterized protein n=1 Tax=uncultured Planctomycetota bacterium TaxID=120965 RepID=H5SCB3_9BACT|nr:hypothetical protein HGMM_F08F10C18 [uncultured Planctomycetota bacterium]